MTLKCVRKALRRVMGDGYRGVIWQQTKTKTFPIFSNSYLDHIFLWIERELLRSTYSIEQSHISSNTKQTSNQPSNQPTKKQIDYRYWYEENLIKNLRLFRLKCCSFWDFTLFCSVPFASSYTYFVLKIKWYLRPVMCT